MGPANPHTKQYEGTTFESGDGLDLHKSELPLRTQEDLLQEALDAALSSEKLQTSVGSIATAANVIDFQAKSAEVKPAAKSPEVLEAESIEAAAHMGKVIIWARTAETDIPRPRSRVA